MNKIKEYNMKRLFIYMLAGMTLAGTSCSDFLDTVPKDALSPATTWQTEADAEKFLIGCYDGWGDETGIMYWDCGSDFGFNYHIHENWKNIGNGSMTASNQVADYYDFSMIRRCNTSGVSSGRTSTAFCRTMGPPSHSGLTKWTVAPDSLTP